MALRVYLRQWVGAFLVAVAFAGDTLAAGSVEMQVEHLVKNAMAGYNSAMEANDSASFLRYFASNATRETPLSRQAGRAELARYFEAEFKAYKARFEVRNRFPRDGRRRVREMESDPTNSAPILPILPVVGLYEVGSSGQFSSAIYYFDSAKAKPLADLGK